MEISADQELIKILFRNLVNNACKYNDQEEVNIAIKGEIHPRCTVYVKDNGIGIKKRNWPTVFQEFSRIVENKEKSISGTGLGLAICKKIMQLHDGDIDIASSNEHGTMFRLRFAAT
jgi:signal transduction histidine kinase